jgi:hypothetical protein
MKKQAVRPRFPAHHGLRVLTRAFSVVRRSLLFYFPSNIEEAGPAKGSPPVRSLIEPRTLRQPEVMRR